jgi:hypothetical protein
VPFSDRVASKNEIAFARLADKIPHIVLSKTLDKKTLFQDVKKRRSLKLPRSKAVEITKGHVDLQHKAILKTIGGQDLEKPTTIA